MQCSMSAPWSVFLTSVPSSTILIFSFLITACLSVLYLASSSQLRKIPGPILASITSLWQVYITHQRKRHLHDIALHQRYGPIVRVGPMEVSLASPAAVKMVYGTATGKSLKKDNWYQVLAPPSLDGLDLLSEPNMQKYRLQRRQIGPVYAASSIADLEDALGTLIARNLAAMSQRERYNVKFAHSEKLDCLTAAVFSKSTDLIVNGEDDGSIAPIKKSWEYEHWASHMPRLRKLNTWCLKSTGRDLWWKRAPRSSPIYQWAQTQLEALTSTTATAISISQSPNLATKLLVLHRSNPLFTRRHLADMTLAHFGAGTETIGITLSNFLCNVILTPHVQDKIHSEIDHARKNGRLGVVNGKETVKMGEMIQELPFLAACLRESMRLFPVVGVPFPRVVGGEGLVIDEVKIPAGTTVGVNPWVMGRNIELYGEDAAEFRPERWLAMSKEERSAIDSFDQTLGIGPHTCPGKHLAQAILAKVIPMLMMHFAWSFQNPDKEREMECMFGVRWKDVKILWTERSSA